jgi:hypothetical protein
MDDISSPLLKANSTQFAIVVAVIVACYRLGSAWLVPNLTLSIKADRRSAGVSRDHLALTVRVNKGAREGLSITDLEARITPFQNGVAVFSQSFLCRFHGCDRLWDNSDGTVIWSRSDAVPRLIAPDESIELAGYTLVEAETAYLIEVVCMVWHLPSWVAFNRHIQWRASTISLPEGEHQSGKPGGNRV